VAVSDPTGTIAEGHETIHRSGASVPWRSVLEVVERAGAECVVVGDPIHLDGSLGERARLARDFAEQMAQRANVRVELQDERLTSVQAERILRETKPGRRRRKEDVDRVAATLILQAWLDRRAVDRE
jgi:putative Holliday junction resolvase